MAHASLGPKTVLVVEDETLIRMAVAESLRDAGYRVLEASCADEATSLLGAYGDIAVLFTDIQMPGPLNGAALTHFVRTHYPGVTVIATSGAQRPQAWMWTTSCQSRIRRAMSRNA
jgi:CheY-like chemotaxis protein